MQKYVYLFTEGSADMRNGLFMQLSCGAVRLTQQRFTHHDRIDAVAEECKCPRAVLLRLIGRQRSLGGEHINRHNQTRNR